MDGGKRPGTAKFKLEIRYLFFFKKIREINCEPNCFFLGPGSAAADCAPCGRGGGRAHEERQDRAAAGAARSGDGGSDLECFVVISMRNATKFLYRFKTCPFNAYKQTIIWRMTLEQ